MLPAEPFAIVYQGIMVVVLVAGAWIIARGQRAKQVLSETAELADLRAERIVELERVVAELQQGLAKVQGEVEILRNLKGEEIANIVISKLRAEGVTG